MQTTLPLFAVPVPRSNVFEAPAVDDGGERVLQRALARLHARARARFDPRHQCFRRGRAGDGPRVRGLTRLLHARLVPERVQQRWERERQESRARARRSGRAHGERVHRQLQHLVRCMRRPQDDDDDKDEACACDQRTNPRALSGATASVLRTLAALRLRPVDAERALYSARGHYATAVDLLCTPADAPGELVLVSVKTGLGVGTRRWRQERQSAERFRAPFDDVRCSVQELAQVQLFCERQLLAEELDAPVRRALVLYCVPADKRARTPNGRGRAPLQLDTRCLPPHLHGVALRAAADAPLCYTEEASGWHQTRPDRYTAWCRSLRQ